MIEKAEALYLKGHIAADRGGIRTFGIRMGVARLSGCVKTVTITS